MIKKGLNDIISALLSRNYEVSLIMSDGVGAVGKLKLFLNKLGIEVDISGAGGHLATVQKNRNTRINSRCKYMYTLLWRTFYRSVSVSVSVSDFSPEDIQDSLLALP